MPYTTEQKAKVVGMYTMDPKPKQIAEKTGIRVNSVKTILRRHRLTGSAETPQRPGRPTKLTERDVRSLINYTKKTRRASLQEITNNCPIKVTPRTIRKILNGQGIYNRIARKKPFLSSRHKTDRLEFAKEYKDWSIKQWKQVIRSDESS